MAIAAAVSQPVSTFAVPAAGDDLERVVRQAIADLRPHLQRDGGDIELVAIDGDLIVVDMKGTCSGCVLASVTLAGVKKRLIDAIGRPVRVVPRAAVAAAGLTVSHRLGVS